MPCDRKLRPKQTIQQRASEVRLAVDRLNNLLMRRRVTPVVGSQGSITFAGWTEADRDGVTDACAYRRIMVQGSALARAEIARAEQLSGRAVDKQVLAAGLHSHDGGQSWNEKG